MAKKYTLFFTGDAPGQSERMVIAGYVFYRGAETDVPKEVFEQLKKSPGFGKPPGNTSEE